MGLLVAVEGIDGSGTTTLVDSLTNHLIKHGMSVHATREPSTGPVGRLLRDILAGAHQPVDDITLALLFAADRADHVQREVLPSLAANDIVLTDRWYHSSFAYQSNESTRAWVRLLNSHAPAPDLTLFVRVSPETAAKRRGARGNDSEIFDADSTQSRVAACYDLVLEELDAEGERIAIIDGNKSRDDVERAAIAELEKLLAPRD